MGEAAKLTVHLLDPSGGRFAGDSRVNVVSAEGGRIVKSSLRDGPFSEIEDGSWTTVLPPGSFRLEANARPRSGCIVPPDPPRAPFCPASAEVVLAAGRESVVEIRLGRAGHLDFVALDPATEFQPGDMRASSPPDASRVFRQDQGRAELGGGDGVLVGAEGRRIEGLTFDVQGGFPWLDWITPGWTARCLDPIPPGRWTLRIEDRGTLLLEREIVIEEGRVTVIRW